MFIWSIEFSGSDDPVAVVYPDDAAQTASAGQKSDLLPRSDLVFLCRNDTAKEGVAFVEPLHTHEFLEIEYVASGTCCQTINGKEYLAKKGDVLFFNIGDSHSYTTSSDLRLLNCVFYPELLQDHSLLFPEIAGFEDLPNFIHLPTDYIVEFEGILQKMEREYANKSAASPTILKCYTLILIAMMLRFVGKPDGKDAVSPISAIIEYVDQHYTTVGLEELAKRFGFSPSYLSKYFKKHTGMTFSKYISDKRIQEAIRLITNTDSTIDNICEQIGFNSKNQFYKMFRSYTGCTPNSLRKTSRQAAKHDSTEEA